MLKRKVPVKVVKVKLHKDVKEFSVWQLLAFALVFALIGGYVIYRSFAVSVVPAPTNLTANTLPGGIVNLKWTAPSGQTVADYKVYEVTLTSKPAPNDTTSTPILDLVKTTARLVGTTAQTNYQLTGLSSGGVHDFYVVAVDSAGNTGDASNHAFAGSSGTRLNSFASLKTLQASTSGTSSFPYASPFGDQNCDNVGQTSTTTDDCVQNCTGSSSCGGSCITVPSTDTLGSTGSCRPMTMQACSVVFGPYKAYQPFQTLWPGQIDQGVDYEIWNTWSKCTYNNPNSKDIESLIITANKQITDPSSASNAMTNSRIYAMGDGELTCVTANPGYSENLKLTQYCLDHKGPIGGPGMGTWLSYKFTASGGAAEGLKVYVAEGCNLASNAINDVTAPETSSNGNSPGHRNLGRRWKAGDSVTKNSILCEVSKGTLETGWADFKDYSYPAAYKCFAVKWSVYGNWSTPWGHSFNEFILKSDSNNLNFSGYAGPHAYAGCPNYHLQDKYKNSAWYSP